VFTKPSIRRGRRLPGGIAVTVPCRTAVKTATVMKLAESCQTAFSKPVMLAAILLKITITASMTADSRPHARPKEMPPRITSSPLTKTIPRRTAPKPRILEKASFSLNITGASTITMTGPQ